MNGCIGLNYTLATEFKIDRKISEYFATSKKIQNDVSYMNCLNGNTAIVKTMKKINTYTDAL